MLLRVAKLLGIILDLMQGSNPTQLCPEATLVYHGPVSNKEKGVSKKKRILTPKAHTAWGVSLYHSLALALPVTGRLAEHRNCSR